MWSDHQRARNLRCCGRHWQTYSWHVHSARSKPKIRDECALTLFICTLRQDNEMGLDTRFGARFLSFRCLLRQARLGDLGECNRHHLERLVETDDYLIFFLTWVETKGGKGRRERAMRVTLRDEWTNKYKCLCLNDQYGVNPLPKT